jgi:signal transduction histidine kinase
LSEGRNGGAGSRFAILFSNVTRRKEAEEERSRLRALEASARAARERISRELHDRVAHHMGVAHQRAAERLDLARETTRVPSIRPAPSRRS